MLDLSNSPRGGIVKLPRSDAFLFAFLRRSGCIFSALILPAILFSPPAHCRTWYIKADGTGDAPTIQAGVDSAAAGDTVLVGPGTYADTLHVMVAGTSRPVNVYIRKPIVLLGEPTAERPFIDGAHSYVGIFVENVDSMVCIGRFELRSTAFSSAPPNSERTWGRHKAEREYPARIRCHSSMVQIFDTVISNDHDGVFLSNSIAEVRDSRIHTIAVGIICSNGSIASVHDNSIFKGAVGVDCVGSSVSVFNNMIGAPEPSGMGNGISCTDGSSASIMENIIEWCGSGVSAIASELTIEGNRFSHHNYGAWLIGCSAVIRNNLFYQGWYAILTSSGTTGEISNNTIDNWTEGIFTELGSSHTIRKNIITRVNWGIVCMSASATIECNDIFDVGSGSYDECQVQPGSGNFSADPEFCGIDDSGNYYLQSDSPCAPGNHPDGYKCGLIGAFPVNCGQVQAKGTSWGSIKANFKSGGEQ